MEISPCMLDNVESVANDGAFPDATKRWILINALKVTPNAHFCYVNFIIKYFMLAILRLNSSYPETYIKKNSSIEKKCLY